MTEYRVKTNNTYTCDECGKTEAGKPMPLFFIGADEETIKRVMDRNRTDAEHMPDGWFNYQEPRKTKTHYNCGCKR